MRQSPLEVQKAAAIFSCLAMTNDIGLESDYSHSKKDKSMFSKRSQLLVLITILFSFSLACALTGGASEPNRPDQDAIEAAVAQTLAADVAASSAAEPETEADTLLEPETEADPLLEPDILFQGISFAFDSSLAENVNAENVPAEGEAGDPWNTSEHVRFTFNNWILADAYHEATIRIFPIEEYKAINNLMADRLTALNEAIDSQDPNHGGIIVAEFFNAAQFFLSKVEFIEFQSGQGVRYITMYGQAAFPIGWPHMFYTFQGITADGKYYVSMVLPVNHPSLPHPDLVTMDNAFFDNFMNYSATTQDQLNGESPESFIPSLILLDDVVESLLVENP
jgi:hypothetical protein